METLAALIFSLLVVGIVVYLLRGKGLREKYAILWLIVGVSSLVLTAIPGMLRNVTTLVGIQVPSNLLFAIAIIFLTGVALHLSWEVSALEEEARTLSEEAAIQRNRLEELERRVDAMASRDGKGSSTVRAAPTDRDQQQHPPE